jgi:hypothetical protein
MTSLQLSCAQHLSPISEPICLHEHLTGERALAGQELAGGLKPAAQLLREGLSLFPVGHCTEKGRFWQRAPERASTRMKLRSPDSAQRSFAASPSRCSAKGRFRWKTLALALDLCR